MGQLVVNPNLVNDKYKIRLAEALHGSLVYETAVDQLSERNTELEAEVEQLKGANVELTRQNEALLAQTGRAGEAIDKTLPDTEDE